MTGMAHHEALYQFVYLKAWPAALDALHQHAADIPHDPLLAHAATTFTDAFFTDLAATGPATHHDALEKLFLLHTGHFYRLPYTRFAVVIESLVTLYADRPEAALGYARHCPENPRCAALLQQYDAPPSTPVSHPAQDEVRLHATTPAVDKSHTISLFKSQQEVAFFMAVREVYPTYFVYPNVALSSVIHFEAIREALTAEERQYFFRCLVDCVVFDQHDGYRPRFFFELDSPRHDGEAQQAKDRSKDRILSLAGQRLYRIRPHAPHTDRAAFVALLKSLP